MPAASPRLSNRAGLLWITPFNGVYNGIEAPIRSVPCPTIFTRTRTVSRGFVNGRDRWFALSFFFFLPIFGIFFFFFSPPNEESIASTNSRFSIGGTVELFLNLFSLLILVLAVKRDIYIEIFEKQWDWQCKISKIV